MDIKIGYNNRLMNESLKGIYDSLDELKFNAGSGDCEAQYFLAMYYARVCGHLHDPNYHYWLEKSKENGYVPGVSDTKHYEEATSINLQSIWDGLNYASHLATLLSLFL